jgi:4-hydroxy-tetrahydrodipicolinate synthase
MGIMVSAREAKSWARENLKGLYAPLTTPFKANGDLDEEGLRFDIQHCMKLRVHGIYWGGHLSDPFALSLDERRRGTEILAEEVGSRGLSTYAYPVDHSMKETIKLAKHAQDLGIDFVMVNPPYEHVKTNQNIYDYYKILAENTDIAICIFNSPHSGALIPPWLINKLTELQAVCATKNAAPWAEWLETYNLVHDKIVVMEPTEEKLEWRVQNHHNSFLSATRSYLLNVPEWQPYAEMEEMAHRGDLRGALAMRDRIKPMLDVMHQMYGVYSNAATMANVMHPNAGIRVWEDYIGMVGGFVRPPSPDLTIEEKQNLVRSLEKTELAKYAKPRQNVITV